MVAGGGWDFRRRHQPQDRQAVPCIPSQAVPCIFATPCPCPQVEVEMVGGDVSDAAAVVISYIFPLISFTSLTQFLTPGAGGG